MGNTRWGLHPGEEELSKSGEFEDKTAFEKLPKSPVGKNSEGLCFCHTPGLGFKLLLLPFLCSQGKVGEKKNFPEENFQKDLPGGFSNEDPLHIIL